jgi:hypothetical protein
LRLRIRNGARFSPQSWLPRAPVVEADADAEAIFWEVRIDDSSDGGPLATALRSREDIHRTRDVRKYSKFDIPFTKGMKIKELAARVDQAGRNGDRDKQRKTSSSERS